MGDFLMGFPFLKKKQKLYGVPSVFDNAEFRDEFTELKAISIGFFIIGIGVAYFVSKFLMGGLDLVLLVRLPIGLAGLIFVPNFLNLRKSYAKQMKRNMIVEGIIKEEKQEERIWDC